MYRMFNNYGLNINGSPENNTITRFDMNDSHIDLNDPINDDPQIAAVVEKIKKGIDNSVSKNALPQNNNISKSSGNTVVYKSLPNVNLSQNDTHQGSAKVLVNTENVNKANEAEIVVKEPEPDNKIVEEVVENEVNVVTDGNKIEENKSETEEQKNKDGAEEPTEVPTVVPTEVPTVVPTEVPTVVPTVVPNEVPTVVPTEAPIAVQTEAPIAVQTEAPIAVPTEVQSEAPTAVPTEVPTVVPTEVPTEVPTKVPTEVPTEVPTKVPTTDVSTTTKGDKSPQSYAAMLKENRANLKSKTNNTNTLSEPIKNEIETLRRNKNLEKTEGGKRGKTHKRKQGAKSMKSIKNPKKHTIKKHVKTTSTLKRKQGGYNSKSFMSMKSKPEPLRRRKTIKKMKKQPKKKTRSSLFW